MNKKLRKLFLIIGALLIALFVGIGAYLYSVISTGFDIDKTVYIYVDKNKSYDTIIQQLEDSAMLRSTASFNLVSSYRNYPTNIKTGRYAILPSDNVWKVVNKLNRGLQTPTKVTFNNLRLKNDLINSISAQLLFSEWDLAEILDDPLRCEAYGFTPSTIISMFIPNTYEFYWDISVESFLARMKKEHDAFWSSSRLEKARKINLSPLEVSILASIVEEECIFVDEYPMVAGLYINRLQRGQLLQADPTVKYAIGDFSLQRILYAHLKIDSPYNTYKYSGLPPSPIRIPSINGLDAVLNYKEHNYLYMCAKEDFSGRHNFATNGAEHERNANRYRNALNQRGIR